MHITKLISLFICLVFIQGCTTTKSPSPLSREVISQQVTARSKGLSKTEQLRQSELIDLYSQWQGTPYRLGGNSKSGIDCSSFVQQVYQAGFGVIIPRTTKEQAKLGQVINKQLVVGDLVFFKTQPKVHHVGIYLGNEKFVHASTSQGVSISKLNNIYWSKHYWQTRRLLD